jgi:hypothetical protein
VIITPDKTGNRPKIIKSENRIFRAFPENGRTSCTDEFL